MRHGYLYNLRPNKAVASKTSSQAQVKLSRAKLRRQNDSLARASVFYFKGRRFIDLHQILPAVKPKGFPLRATLTFRLFTELTSLATLL